MVYLCTIYRILSRSYAGCSLVLCETQLTVVSAFLKLFCSSFSGVLIRLLEFLDSSLWDLRVLYQFHSWSGTFNHFSPRSHTFTSCSSNYRQRSLYGFRMSTLIGWVGGDSFKCVYIVHSTFFSTLRCMTLGWYTSSCNNPRFSSKFVPSFRFPLTSVSTMSSSCYLLMTVFFVVIIGQRMVYGNAPPISVLLQDDELEQALSLADE